MDVAVGNIMAIFDRTCEGSVFFRDVLVAFALTMTNEDEQAETERMTWVFRFLDVEDEDKVDVDDMTAAIARLFTHAKNADDFHRLGDDYTVGPDEDEDEPAQQDSPSTPKGDADPSSPLEKTATTSTAMSLLSNRMSHHDRRMNRQQRKKKGQDKEQAEAAAAAAAAEEERKAKLAERRQVEAEAQAEARKRAGELAYLLDQNRDGFVGREEFLEVTSDEDVIFFDGLAETFRGDLLWGEMTAAAKR